MINQNFKQFLVTPIRKAVWAVLKLFPVIDSSLKVDRFEFLLNRSNILCFMINKRTRCRIYIAHLMINGVCKGPCAFKH